MINARRVFLWIELGLFVLLGLVLPLAACIFYFPGEAIYKFISICMLGLPYLFHLETAPFFVWFWLSAGVLLKLLIMEDDEEITAGGAALAGFGVIIAFFVLYVVIVFALVALYSLDIDTSSALGALAYSISGFTGF